MRITFFIVFLLTPAISPNINFTQIYRVRPTAGSLEKICKIEKINLNLIQCNFSFIPVMMKSNLS